METWVVFRGLMHPSLLLRSGEVCPLVLYPLGHRAYSDQRAVQAFPVLEYFDMEKAIPA